MLLDFLYHNYIFGGLEDTFAKRLLQYLQYIKNIMGGIRQEAQVGRCWYYEIPCGKILRVQAHIADLSFKA